MIPCNSEFRAYALVTHSDKLEPIYFEIKGYLGIYNGYNMIISANEFYLRALMKSIRNERSDRMRDITNTRKLLTRPKTTCQSKVSFTLCKKMIKHSSQAKKSPKRAHYDMQTLFKWSQRILHYSQCIFTFNFFSIKPRSNTRLSQGKRPSRVSTPPFFPARVIIIAKLLTCVIACSFRCS